MNQARSERAASWIVEVDYITRVAQKRGCVSEMNYSLDVFLSYCAMQRNAAEREQFHGIAGDIQNCIDDLTADR